MDHCFTCGGLGFEDKTCPECGREPRANSLNLDRMENVGEFVRKINNTTIPECYHGVFWNVEKLKRDNPDKVADYSDGTVKNDISLKFIPL